MAEFDDAFADLYRRARRLTYGILGDLQSAEDAAAEALVRALTRWHRVRLLPHRDTWVLRVAASIAIDTARRRTVAAPTSGDAGADDDDLVAFDGALVEALIRLPRRQREATVLVALFGCSPVDAVAALDVAASTVNQDVRRGLDRLRVQLAPATSETGRSFPAID